MGTYIYVDNSNVWIEGQFHCAVKQGWASDVQYAHDSHICDNKWRYDFGKLLNVVSGYDVKNVKGAVLFGSEPPEYDTLWHKAEEAGFVLSTVKRKLGGKEKGVDTGFAVKIMKDLFGGDILPDDTVTIVAGDADYVPIAKAITDKNIKLIIAFWDNGSKELMSMAQNVINLNGQIDEITLS